MSINIPVHFVQQYSTNIALLLQQKGSKLRTAVMSGAHYGKQASPVDQVGAIAASRVTGRFQTMVRTDAALDRRWVFPNDYDLSQMIDTFDKLRLMTDPQSAFSVNGAYAMGRAMDDEIIDSYFGDAKTGENGGTTTSFGTTLSTSGGQNVSVLTGAAAATGLNVAKLREAKRVLMANEVDIDSDPLICPITARQHDNLLNEVQVVSGDFGWNDQPVLKEGRLDRFLGINFIHCERLDTGTSDSGTARMVPVYAKSGMYLGLWDDITARVDIRADLRGTPFQLYTYGTFGATRLEEKKIVRVWCAE